MSPFEEDNKGNSNHNPLYLNHLDKEEPDEATQKEMIKKSKHFSGLYFDKLTTFISQDLNDQNFSYLTEMINYCPKYMEKLTYKFLSDVCYPKFNI